MWRPAIGLRALRQHWAMPKCVEQCCRTVDSLARAGHLVRYAQNWAHGCSGENLAVHGRRWTVRAGPGCTMRLPGRTRPRRTTPRSMAAPDARKGCGARVVTGWLRGRNEVVTGRQTREASSEIRAGPFCLSMRSLPVLLTLLAAPANAVSNIPRPPAVPPSIGEPGRTPHQGGQRGCAPRSTTAASMAPGRLREREPCRRPRVCPRARLGFKDLARGTHMMLDNCLTEPKHHRQ
jgi:hypothetical protein